MLTLDVQKEKKVVNGALGREGIWADVFNYQKSEFGTSNIADLFEQKHGGASELKEFENTA